MSQSAQNLNSVDNFVRCHPFRATSVPCPHTCVAGNRGRFPGTFPKPPRQILWTYARLTHRMLKDRKVQVRLHQSISGVDVDESAVKFHDPRLLILYPTGGLKFQQLGASQTGQKGTSLVFPVEGG